MSLETASFLAGLNTSNPTGGDTRSQGDDHIRLLKEVLKGTFPDADKALRIQQSLVDVVSATTVDIGAAASDYLRITGTTTITGLGTVAAGTRRRLQFAGALTLTHNAASLILPGAANIPTAAGDHAWATSLGAGNWVVETYSRANGRPLIVPTAAEFSAVFLELLGPLFIGISFEFNGPLNKIPDRFLPNDGRAISRSTYDVLYDRLGIIYGAGNGTTTFNIPDDRGVVIAGLDNMGTAAGAADRISSSTADTLGGQLGAQQHNHAQQGTFQSGGPNDTDTADGYDGGAAAEVAGENHQHNTTISGNTGDTSSLQPTRFKHKIVYTGVSSL